MADFYRFVDTLLDKTVLFGYDRIGYAIRKRWWRPEEVEHTMHGKICLVTGANAGLGFATARHLARLGATVHMLCRNAERGEAARVAIVHETKNHRVHLHLVDLGDQSAIRRFVASFAESNPRLHVLVNNAGVMLDSRQESVDGIELTFATNTLGVYLLTELCIPLLKAAAPARIINVSSGGMYTTPLHLDDLQYTSRPFDGMRAYAETKRAEVILTHRWAEQLAGTGVTANAVHPGWADTPGVRRSMPRFYGWTRPLLRTPEQGADTIIWLAVNPNLGEQDTGLFWFDRRPRPVHRMQRTRNTEAEIQRFLEICAELTGQAHSPSQEKVGNTA